MILLLEATYRYQWIDFYASELNGLNPSIDQNKSKTILFFGDSFSAQQNGYIDHLRQQFPEYRLINAAIPGTGIIETTYIAKNRIQKFNPDMILIQLYVGNDLIDIRKPINWQKLSIIRNFYWMLSDHLHILKFFNYKFGQLSAMLNSDFNKSYEAKAVSTFSVNNYAPRSKMYLRADSCHIYNSIQLKHDKYENFEIFAGHLNQFLSSTIKDKKTYFLTIPHCTQVNTFYQENFIELGAQLDHQDQLLSSTYNFELALEKELLQYDNISIVKPLPIIQKKDRQNKRLYFENDPHMNSHGNELLAEFLTPLFQKLNE